MERAITESLRQRTITLGRDSELTDVKIDWTQNPPLIKAAVRVSRPNLPTPKQVAAVQDFINRTQKFRYRLLVQRVSIDVIGPETEPNPEPTPVEEPQEVVPEKTEPASIAPAPTAPAPAPAVEG